MTIQKIYKSALASVHVRATIPISLCAILGLTPQAVAETTERVITLSQLQTFPTAVLPPAAIPYRTTGTATQTHRQGARKPKPVAGRKKKASVIDHYKIGLSLKAKGEVNRALVEFLKATHKNPRQINAFYEQALIFRKQGYLKLADSSLEQALRIAKTPTNSKAIKRRGNFVFPPADVNKIRLLLATIRLEQGNISSAAQQMAESLGLEFSKPANAAEKPEQRPREAKTESAEMKSVTAAVETESNSIREIGVPTTILQSLHMKVEEPPAKTRSLKEEYTEEEGSTFKVPVKESTDVKVTDFIRDGLAGLKEHMMNSLSFLPKLSFEQDKTSEKKSTKTKTRKRKKNQKPAVAKENVIQAAEATELKDNSGSNTEAKIETNSNSPANTSKVTEERIAEIVPPNEEQINPAIVENSSQEKTEQLDAFSLIPPAITRRISLLGSLLSVYGHPQAEEKKEKTPEKPLDPITARLKYLAEHGTASLKEGEAFMFSEESGEATLFKPDGEVIRRIVASAKGHEEIAKLRRPDILIPEELLYNLALMAKILPKADSQQTTQITGEEKESAPKLKAPTLLSSPHTFSDWLKDVLSI